MQKVTDIKNRIKSISDTRKITSAMATIAVAKMQKAMAKFSSTRIFFDKLLETINETICRSPEKENVYFNPIKMNGKSMHIVITSDKGMAGAYNSNAIKSASEVIKKQENCVVYTIGQTARNYFERNDYNVSLDFMTASMFASKNEAIKIQKEIIRLYKSEEFTSIYLSYTNMNEHSSTSAVTIKLLPFTCDASCNVNIQKEESCTSEHLELYPSIDELLDSLVPKYLSWVLFSALGVSQASEHYSRRIAMNSATKNADELLGELKISYNQARQESITNELNEIITTTQSVNVKGGG